MKIKKTYILPAEWYPQDAIQLTWPHVQTDWAPYLDDITQTYLQLADTITKYEHLIVATPEPDHVWQLLKNNLADEQIEKILFYLIDSNDTWARDHGGITTINPLTRALTVLDFRFNGWGEKFEWEKDNQITKQLFVYQRESSNKNFALSACIEENDDFVLEGGSIESDGEGTVFTTSQCLMAPHRNQPLTQIQIEQQLKERLGVDRVVWFDHGNLIGDDTDGHIDTIVRICPDHTLLYVGTPNKDDEHYADFKALEDQIRRWVDTHYSLQSESKYKMIALPFPDAIYDEGERLPATYANFLILNGAVIVPTYNQPEKDQKAIKIIQDVFPTRKIIGIDSRTIIRQHGSIHCLTMQYPQGILLKK
ncbi:agmatine deiminase family protein [Segatella bryantii]|jgi:agmatine/peptidylarginine deiminase|uniref:agmatine deiminase family protein n=1 Tax=Segatella bryantii TaxID=77095 RepID=UPI0008953423|nr:agmatine deiminase family protein [Segatella bryantii]MDR4929853.1 agmatine deiminase family protein [Segatella bryantii]UKK75633.1 agmatine deiminase family protein [Segatella bryantii]SDZ82651.1 agmatine deiminase [Segatella bryantii]